MRDDFSNVGHEWEEGWCIYDTYLILIDIFFSSLN